MKATDFLQTVKKINRIEAVQSHGSMNAFLLSGYQIQTGQTVFRTFRKWKEAGWNVRKGESSFPIFSVREKPSTRTLFSL